MMRQVVYSISWSGLLAVSFLPLTYAQQLDYRTLQRERSPRIIDHNVKPMAGVAADNQTVHQRNPATQHDPSSRAEKSETARGTSWLKPNRPSLLLERDVERESVFEQFGKNTRELFQQGRETFHEWSSRSSAAWRSAREEIWQNTTKTWDSISESLWGGNAWWDESKVQPPRRGQPRWYPDDSRR